MLLNINHTMKLVFLSSVLIAYLSETFINLKSATNNVCKTFEDYYSDRDNNENCYYNPDHKSTVPEIIKRNGYPLEIHEVTTTDGYILTIFRISPKGTDSEEKKKMQKPVFLQHGFASSSSCFINIGSKSLGFILADQGYDVWLGNFRGSTYSTNHTHLNSKDSEFWEFTINEYGTYDIPAQIDLVTSITQQKIIYIGFSMGTTAMYIYGITYPEIVQERISIFINLSPSVYLGDANPLIRYPLYLWFIVEPIVQYLTNGKLFARLAIPPLLIKYACFPYPFQLKLCSLPEMMIFGYSFEQIDPETLPVTYSQNADWTSVRAFTHLSQLVITNQFKAFDYGRIGNKNVYGTHEPPYYNLTKFKIPTYFMRAPNDLMVTKQNVHQLYNSLPEETKPYDIYVVKDENFNHLDFMTARDVVPLVYDHVVDFIHKH